MLALWPAEDLGSRLLEFERIEIVSGKCRRLALSFVGEESGRLAL